MEQPHLSSQLDYLEQKYQESRAEIAKLQQRAETQAYVVQEQAHRIQQLETELVAANTELATLPQFDDKLANLKDELVQLIERRYKGAEPATTAGSNSLIMQQLENHTKVINELRRELGKTLRYEDQITLARTETARLNHGVGKFQAKLDELTNKFDNQANPATFLEEQRRSDLRKLAELQAELPDLRKKIESNKTNVQLVSQQIPQFAKYEVALDSMREESRGYREYLDFQMAQRERQLKDWAGLSESTERRIQEIESSMEKYIEFYQLNKRALSSLQDFQERLQRDQHRFGELQRLSEDRQRVATEKFQAEFEQRWQKQNREFQPQILDFQKSVDALQKRMDALVKLYENAENQLSMILQIIEEDIQSRALAATDWQHRFEELAEGQT